MSAHGLFDPLMEQGWDEIQRRVRERRSESALLEFKSRRRRPNCIASADNLDSSDREVIAKAMSGLANSDGGVLVVGLETRTGPGRDPDRLADAQAYLEDAQTFARALKSHHMALVEPAIRGVRIEPLVDRAAAPRGVVAVLVPRSDGGTHRPTQHAGTAVNGSTSCAPTPTQW